jgi:hypothetical protein
MVSRVEELGPASGMMETANGMPVVRMRVPVQAPTSADVAVVRAPIDTDTGDSRQQDSRIENAGVEPIPRPARVQPLPGKETRKHERRHNTPKIAAQASTFFGGVSDSPRILRTSPSRWNADDPDAIAARGLSDNGFPEKGHVREQQRPGQSSFDGQSGTQPRRGCQGLQPFATSGEDLSAPTHRCSDTVRELSHVRTLHSAKAPSS